MRVWHRRRLKKKKSDIERLERLGNNTNRKTIIKKILIPPSSLRISSSPFILGTCTSGWNAASISGTNSWFPKLDHSNRWKILSKKMRCIHQTQAGTLTVLRWLVGSNEYSQIEISILRLLTSILLRCQEAFLSTRKYLYKNKALLH